MTTEQLRKIDITGEYEILSTRRNLKKCIENGADIDSNSCHLSCSNCNACEVIARWTGMFRNERLDHWEKRRGIAEKYAPQKKYDAANTKVISFKFNRKTDADILKWLESQPNRQGAVKEAIRNSIK